jgi:mRNA interferase RelE/StbE
MASFKILFKKSVEKDLRGIDRSQVAKLLGAIEKLAASPFSPSSRPLVGGHKTFRLRVGNYRVIYFINDDDSTIEVQRIAHRREVYRN